MLYFLDSGLMCYLLRLRSAADLELHPLRGAIFETFVVSVGQTEQVCGGAFANCSFGPCCPGFTCLFDTTFFQLLCKYSLRVGACHGTESILCRSIQLRDWGLYSNHKP